MCGRDIPKQLTTEEVYELIKGYGEAARRAMEAGADAVEIHMAHGYLVSTFLSPRTNKRVDEFGGCFENRMRFSRLIIEEVKKQHREKLQFLQESTVQMRFRADLMSTTVQQSQHIWKAADWTDSMYPVPFISRMSLCGHRPLSTVDSSAEVEEIKRAVNIPVITVGRYTEPQFAELMVKEGRADLVAFGRQSLADPAMPKKAQEERLEDMTPCIACLQGCVANMYAGNPVCCLTNPFLGHEAEPLEKAEEPKKVMVIGGGVAGLSAAFIAKERGHEVTLYEAGDVLGGNMRLAAYPPGKVTSQT